jgi:hypothetical protein
MISVPCEETFLMAGFVGVLMQVREFDAQDEPSLKMAAEVMSSQ